MIKNKNSWEGTPQYRKEASVRFVSDDLRERRSEVRLIGGDSYGK